MQLSSFFCNETTLAHFSSFTEFKHSTVIKMTVGATIRPRSLWLRMTRLTIDLAIYPYQFLIGIEFLLYDGGL